MAVSTPLLELEQLTSGVALRTESQVKSEQLRKIAVIFVDVVRVSTLYFSGAIVTCEQNCFRRFFLFVAILDFITINNSFPQSSVTVALANRSK